MVSGGADRLIPDAVALVSGMQAEHALDPSLAPSASERLWQVSDDRVKASGRGPDRVPHLPDLPLVLDESHGGQQVRQLLVGIAGLFRLTGLVGRADALAKGVNRRRQVPVRVAHDPDRGAADILAEALRELVDVAGGQGQLRLDVGQAGTHAHPELAVTGVPEELLRVTAGQGTEIQD